MSDTISFTDSSIKADRLLAALPSTMPYFPMDTRFVTLKGVDDRRKLMGFLNTQTKGWSRSGGYKSDEVFAFELAGDSTLFRLRF